MNNGGNEFILFLDRKKPQLNKLLSSMLIYRVRIQVNVRFLPTRDVSCLVYGLKKHLYLLSTL